jgi:glycosyltransferase involved in cell wall biosynthesis
MKNGPVSVVVIVFNDADLLSAAVTSALAQGDRVGEVLIVDDASTDGTSAVAAGLAADPRVTYLPRTENSGGCGTPRNDGAAAATGEWILFLDSDDVLPPGAVDALFAKAKRHNADVVAGLCVRRELPKVRDVPWQPQLFQKAGVYNGLTDRPETLWDTLSVNKLYRRDFLRVHGIRFPDGKAHYEDFVFTARVYAASPRFAVITDTVYVWQVRREEAASISLRRDDAQNWLDRVDAHRQVVEILDAGAGPDLAAAAEHKFVGHDLRLYLRDLDKRPAAYRQQWWDAARGHLKEFRALASAPVPERWAADVIMRYAEPVDTARLAELAAEPARLVPPYGADDRGPVWSTETKIDPVRLDGLDGVDRLPVELLPISVEAAVRSDRQPVLDLAWTEMYGRLARAVPQSAAVELRDRYSEEVRTTEKAEVRLVGDGRWAATVPLPGSYTRPGDPFTVWDLWVRTGFADGAVSTVKLRAGGTGLGRRVRPTARNGMLFEQFYATSSRSLAMRVAGGVAGVKEVLGARLRRLTN